MEHIQLYTKINYLQADLKSEINNFIDFFIKKEKRNKENTCKTKKEQLTSATTCWKI